MLCILYCFVLLIYSSKCTSYQWGDRRIEFQINNRTQWNFTPSSVPSHATGGIFTTQPSAIPAHSKGSGGVVQQKAAQTTGIQCVLSYKGPDYWKAITYAAVPRNLESEKPSTKVDGIANVSISVLTMFISDFLVQPRSAYWTNPRGCYVSDKLHCNSAA